MMFFLSSTNCPYIQYQQQKLDMVHPLSLFICIHRIGVLGLDMEPLWVRFV